MQGGALRDRADDFARSRCTILGASFDTPEDNLAFATEQGFPFPLLSDVDRAVGERYEAVRDPGDQYASFPRRVSYLIDGDGVIRRAYEVTDVAGHAGEVLADLGTLQRDGGVTS